MRKRTRATSARAAVSALALAALGAAAPAPPGAPPESPLVDLDGERLYVPPPLPPRDGEPVLPLRTVDLAPCAERLGREPGARLWRAVDDAGGMLLAAEEEGARQLEQLRGECPDDTERSARAVKCRRKIAAVQAQMARKVAAIQRRLRQDRAKAIEALGRFVRKVPDDPARTPDALLLLASLQTDRALDEHAQALERHAAAAGRRKGRAPPPPAAPDYAPATASAKRLRTGFPQYERSDVARYLGGWLEQQAGDLPGAASAYRELVRSTPGSPFAAEAWYRLGLLDKKMTQNLPDREVLRAAERALTRAVETGTPEISRRALGSLVLVRYRLDQADAALQTAERLLGVARPGSDSADVVLARRVAGYVIAGRSVFGTLSRLEALRAAASPLAQPAVVEAARDRLRRTARPAEAARLALAAVDEEPRAPEAAGLLADAVEDLRLAGDGAGADAALERLRRTVADGSPWVQANAARPRVLDEALDALERAVRAPLVPAPDAAAASVRSALLLCGVALRAAAPATEQVQLSMEGDTAKPSFFGSVVATEVAECVAERLQGAPAPARLAGSVTLVAAEP